MSLKASTIAQEIKLLNIPGMTTRDLSDMHTTVSQRDLPMFMPDPDAWGGEMTSEQHTFGMANARYWVTTRNLGYVYWHAQAGTSRDAYKLLKEMSDKRDVIIEAICELDVDDVDVVGVSSTPFQMFIAPGGDKSFHGFGLSIIVNERINA